jgi:hypothetical protein
VATKRQQVISEFAHLSRLLEEQQGILLAQLEKLDGDILKQQEEFEFLISGEIYRFSTLVEELEEKNERPARELLTVRPEPAHMCSLGSLHLDFLSHTSFSKASPHPRFGSQDQRSELLSILS